MKMAFPVLLTLAATFMSMHPTMAQDATRFELLWPNGAPGAMGDKDADKPGVWVYPAAKPNGASIVICPGGGYAIHATDHEGVQPAKYFNSIGVTAFVLRYRLSPYRHPAPLQDAQRAIRWVRANAKEFSLDPNRVGIMGFSAGGHLTSTAVTHFDAGNASAADPIDQQSCRPNFGILGYPVVSFVAEYSHKGSANNLLGANASEESLKNLSNDTQVTAETPPVFLFHTSEDTGVPPENSVAFYAACRRHKVAAELHIFQQGPHGVGLAPGNPALEKWINAAGTWLRQNALLSGGKRQAVKGSIKLAGQPLKFGTIAFNPVDTNAPVAWAMVRNGQFQIPESAGPVLGKYTLAITNQGDVAPEPTIDDASPIGKSVSLTFDILDGQNEVSLELPE